MMYYQRTIVKTVLSSALLLRCASAASGNEPSRSEHSEMTMSSTSTLPSVPSSSFGSSPCPPADDTPPEDGKCGGSGARRKRPVRPRRTRNVHSNTVLIELSKTLSDSETLVFDDKPETTKSFFDTYFDQENPPKLECTENPLLAQLRYQKSRNEVTDAEMQHLFESNDIFTYLSDNEENIKCVRQLLERDLITQKIKRELFVWESVEGQEKQIKWNFPIIQRLLKVYADHGHEANYDKITSNLRKWEGDDKNEWGGLILTKPLESSIMRKWCCWLEQYQPFTKALMDRKDEDEKREIYELCRTGIISHQNKITNGMCYEHADYDWETPWLQSAQTSYFVRYFNKMETNALGEKTPYFADIKVKDAQGWLKLTSEQRWKFMCLKDSYDILQNMECEKLLPLERRKELRITILPESKGSETGGAGANGTDDEYWCDLTKCFCCCPSTDDSCDCDCD